jgi:hypothetical protein
MELLVLVVVVAVGAYFYSGSKPVPATVTNFGQRGNFEGGTTPQSTGSVYSSISPVTSPPVFMKPPPVMEPPQLGVLTSRESSTAVPEPVVRHYAMPMTTKAGGAKQGMLS